MNVVHLIYYKYTIQPGNIYMKLLELYEEPITKKNDFLFEDRFLIEAATNVDEIPLGRGGRASIIPLEGGKTRLVIIEDPARLQDAQVYDFTRNRDAVAARQAFADNNTTSFNRAVQRGTQVDATRFQNVDDYMRRAQNMSQDEMARKNGLASRVIRGTGRILRYFVPVLTLAGLAYEEWLTTLAAIDLVDEDNNLSQDEKRELKSIIRGVSYTKLGILTLWIVRRATALRKIIIAARTAVAAGSLFTGPFAWVPFILGQVAITVAVALLNRPAVKVAFADWLAGNIMGDLFEGVETLVNTAASMLDSLTGGLIGSQNLNRAIGWEEGALDAGVQGEVVASSEWAKLVFQDIIFPPDMDPLEVPYFNEAQRTNMLRQAFQDDGFALETGEEQPDEQPAVPPEDQPFEVPERPTNEEDPFEVPERPAPA
jgi:hypothetical protein